MSPRLGDFNDQLTVLHMLVKHMNSLMDQGLELSVYAFRWPMEYLHIVRYTDKPRMKLLLKSVVLLDLWLEANPINPNVVDTYISGEIAEFIKHSRSPLVAI